jgi:hypothetical protein
MICCAKTLDATQKGRKDFSLNGSSHMDLLIMQVFTEEQKQSHPSQCIFIEKDEEVGVTTPMAVQMIFLERFYF